MPTPHQKVAGHAQGPRSRELCTVPSARKSVTLCRTHGVTRAGTDTRARPTVPHERPERLTGREPSAPVPARLRPPPRRPPRPLAAANASAAAAAAAGGRLPGGGEGRRAPSRYAARRRLVERRDGRRCRARHRRADAVAKTQRVDLGGTEGYGCREARGVHAPRGRPRGSRTARSPKRLPRSPKCLPNVSRLRVVGQLARRAQLDVAVDRSPVTRGIERNKRHTSADAQGRLMSGAVALLE